MPNHVLELQSLVLLLRLGRRAMELCCEPRESQVLKSLALCTLALPPQGLALALKSLSPAL